MVYAFLSFLSMLDAKRNTRYDRVRGWKNPGGGGQRIHLGTRDLCTYFFFFFFFFLGFFPADPCFLSACCDGYI